MKKLLSIILATLMLVSIVGCGGGSTPAPSEDPAPVESGDPAPAEKRQLRIAAESWQVTKIFLEEAAAAFEKDHPDVDVEIITMADTSVLTTYSLDWVNGHTDVDLVFADGITYANQFASQDLIYDFEKDLGVFDNYDKSKLIDGVLDYSYIDGRMVLFPVIYEVYALCVNRAMFEEAGLVDADGNPIPIETWDQFYDYAKKMTKYDASGKMIQQGASLSVSGNTMAILTSLIVAQNGYLYKDDGITIDYDTEGLREVLENWKKGVRDGYYSVESISDTMAPRNNYQAGNVAMITETGGRWMEAAPMLGEENLGVMDLPGGKGTFGFTNGVVCPKVSPNADLAVQFIQEQFLGEYVQTNTFNQYGKMPVVREYYDAGLAAHPLWKGIEKSLDSSIGNPAYKDIGKMQDGLLNIMAEGLLNDDVTVDEMIADMVELVDSIEK